MDRRSVGIAVGAFAVVFCLVAVVEGVILSTRLEIAVPVAVVVAAGMGGLAYVRSSRVDRG